MAKAKDVAASKKPQEEKTACTNTPYEERKHYPSLADRYSKIWYKAMLAGKDIVWVWWKMGKVYAGYLNDCRIWGIVPPDLDSPYVDEDDETTIGAIYDANEALKDLQKICPRVAFNLGEVSGSFVSHGSYESLVDSLSNAKGSVMALGYLVRCIKVHLDKIRI